MGNQQTVPAVGKSVVATWLGMALPSRRAKAPASKKRRGLRSEGDGRVGRRVVGDDAQVQLAAPLFVLDLHA
jgi:hypothetical protein